VHPLYATIGPLVVEMLAELKAIRDATPTAVVTTGDLSGSIDDAATGVTVERRYDVGQKYLGNSSVSSRLLMATPVIMRSGMRLTAVWSGLGAVHENASAQHETVVFSVLGTFVMVGLIMTVINMYGILHPVRSTVSKLEIIAHLDVDAIADVLEEGVAEDGEAAAGPTQTSCNGLTQEGRLLHDNTRALAAAVMSFARFMPVDVVRELLTTGTIARVDLKHVQLHVLFTDIQGFTSISEALGQRYPNMLSRLLNRFFGVVCDSVADTGGTVDKFIGDCVMAFWGAPKPHSYSATAALLTALDLVETLKADSTAPPLDGTDSVSVSSCALYARSSSTRDVSSSALYAAAPAATDSGTVQAICARLVGPTAASGPASKTLTPFGVHLDAEQQPIQPVLGRRNHPLAASSIGGHSSPTTRTATCTAVSWNTDQTATDSDAVALGLPRRRRRRNGKDGRPARAGRGVAMAADGGVMIGAENTSIAGAAGNERNDTLQPQQKGHVASRRGSRCDEGLLRPGAHHHAAGGDSVSALSAAATDADVVTTVSTTVPAANSRSPPSRRRSAAPMTGNGAPVPPFSLSDAAAATPSSGTQSPRTTTAAVIRSGAVTPTPSRPSFSPQPLLPGRSSGGAAVLDQQQQQQRQQQQSTALSASSMMPRFQGNMEGQLLRAVKDAPLRVRVGVHGGLVHVGNMGCDERLSYTAIGDAVNTASRLEGFVKHMEGPCDIICGADVLAEAHPALVARYIGPVRLVGKTDPVVVSQVLAVAAIPTSPATSFAAGDSRGATPIFGPVGHHEGLMTPGGLHPVLLGSDTAVLPPAAVDNTNAPLLSYRPSHGRVVNDAVQRLVDAHPTAFGNVDAVAMQSVAFFNAAIRAVHSAAADARRRARPTDATEGYPARTRGGLQQHFSNTFNSGGGLGGGSNSGGGTHSGFPSTSALDVLLGQAAAAVLLEDPTTADAVDAVMAAYEQLPPALQRLCAPQDSLRAAASSTGVIECGDK
jgi:class 3 adenylate cyclase